MPTYDYKLVRLPKVKGIDKDFYGIGYFAENGEFIFALIKPEMPNQPLRSINPTQWKKNDYKNETEIEILGNIESLP